MNIEARKISIIQQILNIDNDYFVKELEAMMAQLLPKYQPVLDNDKPIAEAPNEVNHLPQTMPPVVEIRKNVSLAEIVAEQNTTSISYAEIQDLAKEGNWTYSLNELLAAID